MSKIFLSADSTCDLGPARAAEIGLHLVPMGVVIKGELYEDKGDFNTQLIYDAVEKDGDAPKTSAGVEETYRKIFEDEAEKGNAVIHISISDKLSVSHQNAKRAAQGLQDVYVIDSKSLSLGMGILCMEARKLIDAGHTAAEIVAKITKMTDQVDLSFIINDLKFLHRGGRASGLQLLGANLLKIRPSLYGEDGKLVPGKKFKGRFDLAVRDYTQYKLEQLANASKDYVAVVHSDIDNAIPVEMIKTLEEAGFKKVERIITGASITIHCGRNTIGIILLNDTAGE